MILQITDKFRDRTPYMNKSYHQQFVDIFISIKTRNIFYRQNYTTNAISDSVDREIEKMTLIKYWMQGVSGEKFDKVMSGVKNDIVNDLDLHAELHKQAILETLRGTNETVNEIKKILLNMNLFIFEPIEQQDYFVTSDNPGFTLLGNKVFNTNFGKFDSIGFPINSKQLVVFMGQSTQSELEIHKRLHHGKLNSKAVEISNFCSIFNSYRYVFCESKKYLSTIVERFQRANDLQQKL